jgi:uncharacterized protein YecE (DUF72 family)
MHGSSGKYTGSYESKVVRELTTFLEKIKVKQSYVYFNNTDSRSRVNDKLKPDATTDAKKLQQLTKHI